MTEILLKDPGLVPNAPDGMSCLLSCMQMVMRTKPDGRVFSFEEMNEILRRKPGLYSWAYGIDIAISREGFDIKEVGTFSVQRLADDGEKYLMEYFGPEAGKVQIENSDMSAVREDARNFLKERNVVVEERVPSLEDVRSGLRDGWYVVPTINSELLNGKPGYEAHSIFVYGCDDKSILSHDPGSCVTKDPPTAGRRISWSDFDKAWSSPTTDARLVAYFRPTPKRTSS